MVNLTKRIVSYFAIIVICFSLSPVAFAEDVSSSAVTWWDSWMLTVMKNGELSNIPLLGTVANDICSTFSGQACAVSPDNLHHGSITGEGGSDKHGTYMLATCRYCRDTFKAYASDLSTAYDAYVSTLPATALDSVGYIYWYPDFDYGCISSYGYGSFSYYFGNVPEDKVNQNSEGVTVDFSFDAKKLTIFNPQLNQYLWHTTPHFYFRGIAPIDGYYTSCDQLDSFGYLYSSVDSSVISNSSVLSWRSEEPFVASGSVYSFSTRLVQLNPKTVSGNKVVREVFTFGLAPVKIRPLDGVVDATSGVYTPETRVGSITGDYGIIGDNGEITKVDGNVIVDESNNTVYNPVTNTTTNITDWTYDYSTRTYTVTLDTGAKQTITYGDEHVIINEGDTVYNVYYIVQGGGETPVDPETCQHQYTSVVTTEPTCTAPGLKTNTCTICGKSYPEKIPATGHTWTVKQQVQTVYDENGNLVTQGYTIYECSVCHEQYKDQDGTGPPGGGGSGSDDSGGNWFTKLLGKIGELLGSVAGGLLEIIGNALLAVLDSLITLVTTAVEKLAQLVNLFGSFGEALRVLWTWLPEDIITVLVAGVTVVIFVTVLKIFRR